MLPATSTAPNSPPPCPHLRALLQDDLLLGQPPPASPTPGQEANLPRGQPAIHLASGI